MRLLTLNFLTLVLLTNGESGPTDVPRVKHKLIIVGAGVSGISAASHLWKNNFTDFIILESSDRLGGRLNTAPFADYIIEYGCQWVHGQDGNIVYEIVSPHNVVYVQNFEENVHYFKGPDSKINISKIEELYKEINEIFENSGQQRECNCSMDSYLYKGVDQVSQGKNVNNESKQALFDLLKKMEQTLDGTDDLKNVGTWGSGQYLEANGSKTVAWRNGYKTFIDIILGKYETKKLPLLDFVNFNKVVVSIDYTGDNVYVLCEDGTHYYADHVLSTVSLGVLKHSAKTMFKPVLPERKQSAIDALGFDLVGKIFIQFEKRWWPLVYENLFQFLWSDEDRSNFKNKSKHGNWSTEIICFHFIDNQPRVLLGWVTGRTARIVETLPERELLEGVMELFHHFMGDHYNITQPINITRTTWYNNRFVRGVYSFRTLESDRLGLSGSDLAEPILSNKSRPVLLFSGEASSNIHYGTVHGAFETGLREAKRLLNFLE